LSPTLTNIEEFILKTNLQQAPVRSSPRQALLGLALNPREPLFGKSLTEKAMHNIKDKEFLVPFFSITD
jgi:hypothetical protein